MKTSQAFAILAAAVTASACWAAPPTHTKKSIHKPHHKAKRTAHKSKVAQKDDGIRIVIDGRNKALANRNKVPTGQAGTLRGFPSVQALANWANSLGYYDGQGLWVQIPWTGQIGSSDGKTLYTVYVYPFGNMNVADIAVFSDSQSGIVPIAWQNNVTVQWPPDPTYTVELTPYDYIVSTNQAYGSIWLTPYTEIQYGGVYGAGIVPFSPGARQPRMFVTPH